MAFREVSNQSWGGRLVSSIGGALLGVLLFLASFPLLFWNEGRAVQTEKSLEEGTKSVVSVEADKVDSANEGKLVHITAKAATDETPTDPDFGVTAPRDIRLVRTVEMYQNKEEAHTETKKNLGGSETTTTTYTYTPGWYKDLQNSSNFHEPGHQNPSAMPFRSDAWQAKKVTAGAFVLPADLVNQIKDAKDLPVAGPADAGAPKTSAKDKEAPKGPADAQKDGPAAAVAKTAVPVKEGYQVFQGHFYKGEDPSGPAIGDVRVSYQVVEPTEVSVIAKQTGSSFTPYQAHAGDQIAMLVTGAHDAASMFQQAEESNKMLTWILRVVGFALMAFGLFLVMSPLSVLGDVVPFIGNMVGALLAFVAGLIALAFSLITISIAWLFYRPLIGVPLLAAGVAALVLVFMLARKKKAPTVEAA